MTLYDCAGPDPLAFASFPEPDPDPFHAYDRYLELDLLDPRGLDIGMGKAAVALARFTVRDCESLAAALGSRGARWLARCARSLGGVDELWSVAVLLRLSQHWDDNVATTALQTLTGSGQASAGDGSRQMLEAIGNLKPRTGHLVHVLITALEHKLKALPASTS
ncbi:hypothetical protein [Caldimonas brevitalea]|uniref:Uncharacterized protein n=1 Tax=Caldimonas brevitalea TaxID=413882 RepID=A0A0G3BZB0_9BURK|nr:hypothetical protein [Caldimonas brevitalea]AKJ31840.1 hypothetical protein AAW51_5149 [Caldimonas brevitalea]